MTAPYTARHGALRRSARRLTPSASAVYAARFGAERRPLGRSTPAAAAFYAVINEHKFFRFNQSRARKTSLEDLSIEGWAGGFCRRQAQVRAAARGQKAQAPNQKSRPEEHARKGALL